MPRFLATLLIVIAIFAGGCAGTARRVPQPRYEAAREAYFEGDAETAAREAKLLLQGDPLAADAHFLLACLLAQQGEQDQATVGFRRAWMLDPAHPTAAYNVGTMHLRRKEAVPAARWLEESLSSHPGHVPSLNNLGKAYFLSELPELAIACYEEALLRDPANAVALGNLATLRGAAGLDESAARAPRPHESGSSDAAGPAAAEDAAPTQQAPGHGRNPASSEKKQVQSAPARPDQNSQPTPATNIDDVRELVRDLPHVAVEQRAGRITLTGWTRDSRERTQLDRILVECAGVLDLTTDDNGDPQQMIEVDATIFVVIALDSTSEGFNFLRMVNHTFDFFVAGHRRDGTGFAAPDVIDMVEDSTQIGWLYSASVDYDVNIANALDERVAVLARPHLTTLSGTPASFLAGGEIVFRVAGNISGDIKPYPFGTTLKVVATPLRTPAENGARRVHLKVAAGRSSILDLLAQSEANLEDSTIFDKIDISAEAVLDTNRTLILSGLNQKERRSGNSGVPVLRSIPVIRYFFSTRTSVEVDTSVIILLTPRDPAFHDERNRAALEEFVQQRRAFVRARQGTEEDFRHFTERYPNWRDLPPNRFASHFFLVANSELYRAASGYDLAEEDISFDILDAERRP